jgi:hypothetical protein
MNGVHHEFTGTGLPFDGYHYPRRLGNSPLLSLHIQPLLRITFYMIAASQNTFTKVLRGLLYTCAL